MYPQGKMKALTLSYDDGVEQDQRLTEILNYHKIKATFNLNSGIQTGANISEKKGRTIRRLNIADLPRVYAGHEIALHSLTHPHLETLDEHTIRNELEQDKINLERIFGKPVQGMAYPFGTYNDLVVKTVGRCGLRYARGIKNTYSFDIPRDLLVYQPTCHHRDPRLMELAEQFLRLKPNTPRVFYVWGHQQFYFYKIYPKKNVWDAESYRRS
jgi:peptidoglycan/xylan/chitin deacetylase (PgdA/CDA1 family)